MGPPIMPEFQAAKLQGSACIHKQQQCPQQLCLVGLKLSSVAFAGFTNRYTCAVQV